MPVTLNLLKTAGIEIQPASGEMWRFTNGEFKADDDDAPDWGLLMKKLNQLKEDCSIEEFLQREFSGDEHKDLRNAVRRFVSGYDSADPKDASAFALRNEWQHEDDSVQHRVKGGYSAMINFLADECKAKGADIYLNCAVTDIHHHSKGVEAFVINGDSYSARHLIIALLKATSGEGAVNSIRRCHNIAVHSAILDSLVSLNCYWSLTQFSEKRMTLPNLTATTQNRSAQLWRYFAE